MAKHKKIVFCYYTLGTVLYKHKISVTTAKFNGLSFEIDGSGITHLELKILAKI